jgi:hypothetical protein
LTLLRLALAHELALLGVVLLYIDELLCAACCELLLEQQLLFRSIHRELCLKQVCEFVFV